LILSSPVSIKRKPTIILHDENILTIKKIKNNIEDNIITNFKIKNEILNDITNLKINLN
jgi:hypothetical protein